MTTQLRAVDDFTVSVVSPHLIIDQNFPAGGHLNIHVLQNPDLGMGEVAEELIEASKAVVLICIDLETTTTKCTTTTPASATSRP